MKVTAIRYLLASFYLLIHTFSCLAQRDSLFIREYHDKLVIKPYLGGPDYNLNFFPKNSPDSVESAYTSNTYGVIGIDMAYKAFSFGLSKRAGDLLNENVYGKTKYASIGARFGFRRFSFEGVYRKFKGYADLNTKSYYKSLPDSTPYYIRNDIQNSYFKIKAVYQFSSKRFSAAAPFSFTERQLKSAITPFALAYFNTSRLRGDSSVIPFPVKEFYGDLHSINHINVTGVGIAPGFGFTIVFKQLFFSATIFGGVEFQNQKYYLEDQGKWENKFRVAPAADSRLSLGVNGNRSFLALTVRNDVNNMSLRNFRIQSYYSIATIDFGYRFNAPGIVVKTYDKAGRLLKNIRDKF